MSEFISPTQVKEAATAVSQLTSQQPTIGLILGSGLSGLADGINQADIIPAEQIPHWPISTAPGHQGRLLIGKLEGQTVLVLQGRVHYYEGYGMSQITLPVRVMHMLGVNTPHRHQRRGRHQS